MDVIPGVSKGSDRPKWSKLNSILKSGDEVVSYRLDRFGRSAVDVISNIKDLMKRDIKVSILSPKMSFDKEDYFSQFLLTLFSGLSEMERNITKERQKAGIAARREAKKKHPELLLSRRPLSYAVRKNCYGLYLSGLSVFEIRQQVKKNHDLPKKPGRQTVYDIINEFKLTEKQKEDVLNNLH
ncbi:recombinase family protein [Parasaccharibacter apium]|uniref:recombinase family protein n=1 Tax=Parasaccharibacter apium TaxID=1510841 RepID=UPI00141512E2|nr:recombinase family protein [Parasaccharibacter apium]